MTELLVDKRIREAIESNRLTVSPYDPSLVQPNSLDVRLGNTESRYVSSGYSTYINPADEAPRSVQRQVDKIVVKPGDFVLVETLEYFRLPDDIVGMVMGKSSSGRLGIDTENAGLIDSGFEGTITLELYNKTSNIAYVLPVGFPIAQVVFFSCEEVETPYHKLASARYCGQRGATPFRVKPNDSNDRTAPDETHGTPSPIGEIINNLGSWKRGKKSGRRAGNSADSGEQN